MHTKIRLRKRVLPSSFTGELCPETSLYPGGSIIRQRWFLGRAALAEEALRVLLLPPWPSVFPSLHGGDGSPGPCGLGWPRLVLPLTLSCLESSLTCRLQGDRPVSEVTTVPSLSGCCPEAQPCLQWVWVSTLTRGRPPSALRRRIPAAPFHPLPSSPASHVQRLPGCGGPLKQREGPGAAVRPRGQRLQRFQLDRVHVQQGQWPGALHHHPRLFRWGQRCTPTPPPQVWCTVLNGFFF